MASITKQTVGNNTYLYEAHSFRDDEGRPRNRKVKIGKIDRNTGSARYTVELPAIDGLEEHVRKALDSLKIYGLFYFLQKAGEKIKLIKILKETFPAFWEELFMLCNAIESLNYQLRKVTKNRSIFSTDDAILKILYLAIRNASKKWTMPIRDWGQALNQFAIEFGKERVPF